MYKRQNVERLVDPAKETYWGGPDFYIGGAEHAVLHLLYARFWHRFLYDERVLANPEPFKKLFHQGLILGEDGNKMSKSVGNVVNPMIVDGQIHGGIAQGVAQALWESGEYNESGQLVSGSMMDYAIPRTDCLPSFELDRTVTPSPTNPLGVKGVGETGTIASTPAVVNAVMDALSPFGVTHLDMPLTSQKIWNAIQS